MAGKQKIIDGIDVSECKYVMQGKHNTLCAGSEDSALCDANNNCLYKKYKRKEQECKRLKWYMQEIRMQELYHLDIEWDEYETYCANTEYSNIINLVEEALEERSLEDCRYGR